MLWVDYLFGVEQANDVDSLRPAEQYNDANGTARASAASKVRINRVACAEMAAKLITVSRLQFIDPSDEDRRNSEFDAQ
ncbi:hypothetical protein RB195_014392 [Necator americanus]|uniref:Uncharacterized protein n=1 Tax=Necator americanus TaxID=51031 RepID=A0ABR1E0A0_NECAM